VRNAGNREALVNGYKSRQTQWTDGIAVGSADFVKIT